MTRTHHDDQYEYFLDYFEKIPIRIMRDRKTGEVLFDSQSLATVFCFDSVASMMSDDRVLDAINAHQQETGESPLRKLVNGKPTKS